MKLIIKQAKHAHKISGRPIFTLSARFETADDHVSMEVVRTMATKRPTAPPACDMGAAWTPRQLWRYVYREARQLRQTMKG